MLCMKESERCINDLLMILLEQNENHEVQRILEQYMRSIVSSITVSCLRDSSQATPLHYVAECGNHVIVKYLIDLKYKIDAKNKFGKTPLMLGIEAEHDDVVRVLLRANADIHVIDYENKSALQMILERKVTQSNMIDILLREVSLGNILKGITLHDLSEKLAKAVVIWEDAVCLDNAELLRVLLDREKVHVGIGHGTLLHLAIKCQKFESVKVLLEYGADVDALDCRKATPLRYLHGSMCHTHNQCSQTLETMKILVNRTTMLTSSAEDGRMQIYNILMYGNADAIEIIMRSNVDLNASDRSGNTLMHYVAVNENPGVFAKIRGRKFDANMRNNEGYIPLHYAVDRRSFDAVKFFLENGANANERFNMCGISPLYSAFDPTNTFDEEVVELLLRYGADPQTQIFTSTILDLCSTSGPALHSVDWVTRPKLVIAQLAVVEALGTKITKNMARSIKQHILWLKYLNSCRRMVGRLQKTAIYRSVTLFDFLTASDRMILAYVSNVELVSKLKRIIGKLEVHLPYTDRLRNRLKEAI